MDAQKTGIEKADLGSVIMDPKLQEPTTRWPSPPTARVLQPTLMTSRRAPRARTSRRKPACHVHCPGTARLLAAQRRGRGRAVRPGGRLSRRLAVPGRRRLAPRASAHGSRAGRPRTRRAGGPRGADRGHHAPAPRRSTSCADRSQPRHGTLHPARAGRPACPGRTKLALASPLANPPGKTRSLVWRRPGLTRSARRPPRVATRRRGGEGPGTAAGRGPPGQGCRSLPSRPPTPPAGTGNRSRLRVHLVRRVVGYCLCCHRQRIDRELNEGLAPQRDRQTVLHHSGKHARV